MEDLKFLDFFNNRSTLRNYSRTREVSDRTLEELIAAASHAPNTGNMQHYSVIVTRDRHLLDKLVPLHFNQPAASGCSVMLTFCADLNRFERWCELRDANPGFKNFHSFISALIDTAIFAQQFVTVAELNGLGSCYLGTVTYNAVQISQLLNLPDRVVPVVALSVGYPDDNMDQLQPSDRLPLEGILHKDTYHEYSDRDIDRIYAYKEGLSESEIFIRENGKETLAQVFTDVRYTGEMNEKVSESFAELLRKKGF